MVAFFLRLTIVAVVLSLIWLGARATRSYADSRRQRALHALPPEHGGAAAEAGEAVRILAFSSADCAPCHRLQKPALLRVREARPDVRVVEIDAPSTPELTERYQVLTVPTTVILDARGQAHAVNYGFASSQRLLEQLDALLDEAGLASPVRGANG